MKTPKNLFKKFLILIFLFISASAFAETMTMKQLYYSIWPEYDKPSVLVIYSGKFINDTGKPFNDELIYYAPKGAKINMLCETENGMLCLRYLVEDMGDYIKITWKPSRTINPGEEFPVMFEYYIDYLNLNNSNRSFNHLFRAAFPIQNMTVEVKQPTDSTQFEMIPKPHWNQLDGDFTNYYLNLKDIKENEKISFKISYVRNSSEPSIKNIKQSNLNETSIPTDKKLILIIIVFAAILGFTVAYMLKGTSSKQSKNSPKQKENNKNHKQREKEKLRKLLLDGKISEETYKELLKELNNK
ncbi:hypothetical protein FHQ18_11315 [Deferribacter autotrophicus]|uniref:SHOCT domain-containing protein n=1 Tax=Deferribacter autotrophicus TaxID=500465 RepID=A0A5A8EZP6_9BACT|nr:hypothetical protein [Deferribacter autotrophicus]KAA0257150.1 hypothetical protein FHQ18_11315 [Deferribacter autotrophicus]